MRKTVATILAACSLAWLGIAGSMPQSTLASTAIGRSRSEATAGGPRYTLVTTLSSSFKQPAGLAVTGTGDVYVADTGHHQIRVIHPDGRVDVVAGSGSPGTSDGVGPTAQFHGPRGLAFDETRGVLYVADTGNHVIREVTLDGVVRTVAGSGRPGADDGNATRAEFRSPSSIAIDPTSNVLYVADTGNSSIRAVTSAGDVTTVATGLKQPEAIAFANDGTLYVADTLNHVIRRVTHAGMTTVAGFGQPGFQDGLAATARFNEPSGIAVTENGDVVVGDRLNHRVRLIHIDSQMVETIAGIGQPSFLDGDALSAGFHDLSGVTTAGAVWIADEKNDAVRMLVPEIAVTAIQPARGPLTGGEVRIF